MEERLDKSTVAGSVLRGHSSPSGTIANRVFGYRVILYGDWVRGPIVPAEGKSREQNTWMSAGNREREAARIKATDEWSAGRDTVERGRRSVGGSANSPREKIELVLEYWDRVW